MIFTAFDLLLVYCLFLFNLRKPAASVDLDDSVCAVMFIRKFIYRVNYHRYF